MIQNASELFQGLNGDALERFLQYNCDPGALRPFKGRDGRTYIQVGKRTPDGFPVFNTNGEQEQQVIAVNAPTTMTKDAWIAMDNEIITTVQDELRLVADIRGAGLTYNLPNGLAHTVLQYQKVGDITRATLSMDPVRRSEGDAPDIDSGFLPLPVAHKDFDFTFRQIASSRLGGFPLDTGTGRMAAEKVAQEIEMLTAGTSGTFSYGGGTIYGLINLPERFIKNDMPVPDGTNGPAVVAAIGALKQGLINDKHMGPYVLYLNKQWSTVLNLDYSTVKGDGTLRERILKDNDITDIRILDTLPTTLWHAILLEMKPKTVRMVVGLEVQTVQWESLGGMMRHFKVMALQVPQLRPDNAGNSGVAHGTTA